MTDPLGVVRAWFAAFNHADLPALLAAYADDAVWEEQGDQVRGAEAIGARLAAHLAEWEPALDGGARRRLRTVGRIESGVAAEWVARERHRRSGEIRETTGYAHFLVARGRIERHRESVHAAAPGLADIEIPASRRRYPERPIVGIGGAIVQQGRIVLIRRRYEPLAGQWSLPGGTLELGETLETAVRREMQEETGLEVEVGAVVDVFDRILFDPDDRVRYHFVLVDYLCRPVGGALCAGSDVSDAVFADRAALPGYGLTSKALAIATKALEIGP